MKNKTQPGVTVTIPAPFPTTAGMCVFRRRIFGVSLTDADTGEDIEIMTRGVFDLDKVPATACAEGDPAYRTPQAQVDNGPDGVNNRLLGVVVAAAGSGATTARVLLNRGNAAV